MEINELYDIFRKCGKVTTYSRKVAGGELFFALKGENFDGNLYAAKALEAGAAYAVVDADGVPAFLEFNSVSFDLTLIQQVFYINR